MVFVVDPAKVSMETKHCGGSHNKIERQYRTLDLKVMLSNNNNYYYVFSFYYICNHMQLQ